MDLLKRRAIIMGGKKEYIIFADPNVEAICIANWSSDGIGLTKADAATVTNNQLGTIFRGNTTIETFDELSYFTGLTTFSAYAFNGCTALTSITLPNTITSIGNYAFTSTNLIEFRFPPSMAGKIVTGVLRDNPALVRIYIDNVTCGNYTFSNCPALAEVHSSSLESFFGNAFTGASRTGTPFFNSNAATRGVYIGGVLQTSITVPSTVTAINAQHCYKNNTLTSITFHSALTSIGAGAFNNCTALTGTVTIPSSVTSMGQYAVAGLSGITNLICNSTSVTDPLCFFNLSGNAEGNGTGRFYTAGDIALVAQGPFAVNFKKVEIGGNLTKTTGTQYFINNNYVEEIRIHGNISHGGDYPLFRGTNIKFIELGGTISGIASMGIARSLNSTAILHLGYNGIAGTSGQVYESAFTKIYVGDGTSQAGDQAVLNQYLADSSWANYSSKLDLWWNYSGPYKNV